MSYRQKRSNVGKRAKNGNGNVSFHITIPENDDDHFEVRVKLKAGAPTVQANLAGL